MDAAPRARHELPMVEIDGELLVYDEAGLGVHHLNRVAAVVFHCLDGKSTPGEIAEDVADVLDMPREHVEHDIRDLVEQLRGQGLLEAGDAEEGPGG